MVVRYVRRRHHDARRGRRADLGDRRRARAADDEVGRRHHLRHIIDIFPHVEPRVALQVDALFLYILRHPAPAERAGRVDVAVGRAVVLFALHEASDLLIHLPRAKASPAGDDQRLVPKAERRARLRAVRIEKALAHRRPRDDDAVRVGILPPALREGDHDARDVLFDHPRRQPRHGVRLMHRRRDAESATHLQRREARIAARADDDIRAERADDGLGLAHRAGHVQQRCHIVPDGLRREAALVI